jgi:hypothetical protein
MITDKFLCEILAKFARKGYGLNPRIDWLSSGNLSEIWRFLRACHWVDSRNLGGIGSGFEIHSPPCSVY